MNQHIQTRPPLPPFTRESAIEKVRLAEDGWNSRDPERISLAYTPDSRWRNRAEIATGRRRCRRRRSASRPGAPRSCSS